MALFLQINPYYINKQKVCLVLLLPSRRCCGERRKFVALCNEAMTFPFAFALFHTRIMASRLLMFSKTNGKSSFNILTVAKGKKGKKKGKKGKRKRKRKERKRKRGGEREREKEIKRERGKERKFQYERPLANEYKVETGIEWSF